MFSDPLSRFPEFMQAVSARLDKGRATYGDRSFDRPIPELLGELQQEALDLAGWGFILWARLQALQTALPAEAPMRRTSEPPALTWLRSRLLAGPVEIGELRSEAAREGLRWRGEVRAARRSLPVVTRREGKRWTWELEGNEDLERAEMNARQAALGRELQRVARLGLAARFGGAK